MPELTVRHKSGEYPIIIRDGIRFQLKEYLKKNYSSILIVTDEAVEKLYLNDVKSSLRGIPLYTSLIPSGEASKSMDVYARVLTEAIENGLDRNSLIIALGGGVVGDLAGFAAATFMRGIDYIQVPTTILAHDSSVGGKVAINHPLGKNLIGSFYPPAGVYYDIGTLHTLSAQEVRSGYAELIKEAFISDGELVGRMLKFELEDLPQETLKEFIIAGIKVKQQIVEADELEHGVRSYLNLGHTLAHAIEREMGYGKITHGEAVAIGLLFAIHVSENRYQVKLPFEELHSWLISNQYPVRSFSLDSDRLIHHMKSDKKAVKQQIKMVVLKAPGLLALEEVSDKELTGYLHTFKERLV